MKFTVKRNGKDLEFFAEKIGSQIWVSFEGRTHVAQANQSASKRSQKSAKSQQDGVTSPMPGKITKLVVKDGAQLKAGDVVVVMEAMKMEYTLKAERDASVKKVHVTEGSQVTLGQILVEYDKV